MNLIETNQITKIYKDIPVVNRVSMHVKEGDIYGFVGENGSGKTTIMRLLTGLISPNSGTYSLFGIESTSSKIHGARKNLSALVETATLVGNMTAIENLTYASIYSGLKLTDEEKNELLRLVHLEDTDKKKVKNFSLGMRQRLAIAMALINKPKLILLDEPMNGLDPEGIAELRNLLISLSKEQGITILISSHILSELEKIATCYGFISKGQLLEEISSAELQAKCQKSITIKVEEPKKVEKLLITKNINDFDVSPSGEIRIFDSIKINDLVIYLAKNNIEIMAINSNDESVEDYYLKLVGESR